MASNVSAAWRPRHGAPRESLCGHTMILQGREKDRIPGRQGPPPLSLCVKKKSCFYPPTPSPSRGTRSRLLAAVWKEGKRLCLRHTVPKSNILLGGGGGWGGGGGGARIHSVTNQKQCTQNRLTSFFLQCAVPRRAYIKGGK